MGSGEWSKGLSYNSDPSKERIGRSSRECSAEFHLGWAGLGFPPFFPEIADVDLFPVFHRNLLWHFWGHHAQNEAIIQRGFAVSASSASCFGNSWFGFSFWTDPSSTEAIYDEWTSFSFPSNGSGIRKADYFTSLVCIVFVLLAACFFLLGRGHVHGISLWDPGIQCGSK